MNKLELSKILPIFSFITIVSSLIILYLIPTSTSYEISIYAIYPLYFWIFLIIPTLLPLIAIIFERKYSIPINKLLLVGSIFSIIILLLLPFIRGYTIYGAGDTLTHLSYIQYLSIYGNIGDMNPYPVIHILIYSISKIANIKIEAVVLFLRPLLVIFFLGSIFILSKALGNTWSESFAVTSFATIPVLGPIYTVEYIMPATEAFLLIPFVIFLLLKSRTSFAYSILLVFSLILFAFFHPEAIIYLLAVIVILYFISKYFNKFNKNTVNSYKSFRNESLTPGLILIVGFFLWFGSNLLFSNTVQTIYDAIILNLTPEKPPLVQLMGGFQISIIDAFFTALQQYGAILIYLTLGFVFSMLTLIKYLFKKTVLFKDVFLSCLFLLFVIINIFLLFKGTQIGFSIMRQLKYPLLIAVLIMGTFYIRILNEYLSEKKSKIGLQKIGIILIIVILFTAPFLAVFSNYPSPSIQQFNVQITNEDINGMEFFFQTRNTNYLILETGKRAFQSRFKDYLLGYYPQSNIRQGYSSEVLPPYHFGYDLGNDLGYYYNKNQYLIIYPPSEDLYSSLYPKYQNLWLYSPNDYNKLLNDDPTATLYYNNGEIKLIEITGENNTKT